MGLPAALHFTLIKRSGRSLLEDHVPPPSLPLALLQHPLP